MKSAMPLQCGETLKPEDGYSGTNVTAYATVLNNEKKQHFGLRRILTTNKIISPQSPH